MQVGIGVYDGGFILRFCRIEKQLAVDAGAGDGDSAWDAQRGGQRVQAGGEIHHASAERLEFVERGLNRFAGSDGDRIGGRGSCGRGLCTGRGGDLRRCGCRLQLDGQWRPPAKES